MMMPFRQPRPPTLEEVGFHTLNTLEEKKKKINIVKQKLKLFKQKLIFFLFETVKFFKNEKLI